MPVNTMQEVGQKILPAQQLSQLNQHVENNETTVEVNLGVLASCVYVSAKTYSFDICFF